MVHIINRREFRMFYKCDIYLLVLIVILNAIHNEQVHCLDDWTISNHQPPRSRSYHSEKEKHSNSTLRRVMLTKNQKSSINNKIHPSTNASRLISRIVNQKPPEAKDLILKRQKYSEIPNYQSSASNYATNEDHVGEFETDLQYDEYLEDSPDLVETTSPSTNDSQFSSIVSTTTPFPNVQSDEDSQRMQSSIESLVRSQINFGASNWATLKPAREYELAPNFNDTIQQLASYLSNSTLTTEGSLMNEHDHTIPEDLAHNESSCNKSLYYPNHNYRHEQNTNISQRQPNYGIQLLSMSQGMLQKSTFDPLSASSDESNKYGSLPAVTEPFEPPVYSTPASTVDSSRKYMNQLRDSVASSSEKSEVKRQQSSKVPATSDRLSNLIYTSSHSSEKKPTSAMNIDHKLASSTESIESSSHSGDLRLKNRDSNSILLSSNNFVSETSDSGTKKQRSYKLRPTFINNHDGLDLQDSRFNQSIIDSAGYYSRPSFNGSLALRLNANRYRNWPTVYKNTTPSAKPAVILEQSSYDIHKLLEASRLAGIDPPLGPSYSQPLPPDFPLPTPIPWSSSSSTARVIPVSPATSISVTPLMMSSAESTSPQPVFVTAKHTLTANSSSPSKSIGSRIHRRPAQHHHHHSHIHNIKPALISIPVPVPSKVIHHSYDTILTAAAAAAAAAAASSQKRLARQQVLAQSILSQSMPTRLEPKLVAIPRKPHQQTIPIGGTLASTRNNLPKSQQPPSNLQGDSLSATYQTSLLSHLLETANRALKQVAGNAASLLNLKTSSTSAPPNFIALKSPSSLPISTQRGGSRDYFERPLESQLESIGLYQAPQEETIPLDTYLASLLAATISSSSKNILKHNKLKEEPAILSEFQPFSGSASSSVVVDPNSGDPSNNNESTTNDHSDELVFASLGDNSNLIYPIITSLHSKGQSGSLASLLEASDQPSVTFHESPVWTKQNDISSGKRIPLSKHSPTKKTAVKHSGSVNKTKLDESLSLDDTIRLKKVKNNDADQLGDHMPYAVTHYIGETPGLKGSGAIGGSSSMIRGKDSKISSSSSSNSNNVGTSIHNHYHQPSKQNQLQNDNLSNQLIYGIFDDNTSTKYTLNTLDLLPITSDTFEAIPPNHNFQKGKTTNSKLYETLLTSGELDNFYEPTYVFANSDKLNVIQPSTIHSSDDYNKNHGIRFVDDDYRSNESKNQEHVIQIMSQSSLNPGSDPIQQVLSAAASSIKPHLTAASDLINYHKLRFIDHYLQYHLPSANDFPTSESARLAVSATAPKSHLILQFWPIALALLPIMIIVAIIVQLILAAPLVLFAMTTLTVARFVGLIFGPLFSREDISSSYSNQIKSNARLSPSTSIPHTNFLYSVLKLNSDKPTGSKKNLTSTASQSSKNKLSMRRRRRRKRHVVGEKDGDFDHEEESAIGDYFESMIL